MAAKPWDLTRPPFIDERVWSIAIKRRKSGWNLAYYLWLMTVEPTEADVTLRAANSRMNKDYGDFPTGVREAKSVLDVIQERADNLGISYEESRRDVYAAIEWVVCDMKWAYGDPMRNVKSPLDRVDDLFRLYPQMAWYFLTEIFLRLVRMGGGLAYAETKKVLYGVQSAILQNLENKDFAVPVFSQSYLGTGRLIPSKTIGSASWLEENDFYTDKDKNSAAAKLNTAFNSMESYYPPSNMFFSLSGVMLGAGGNRLGMIYGFERLASWQLSGGQDVPYRRDQDTINTFYIESFRDFIHRWPPSAPSGEISPPLSRASLWAAAGTVIGAAAIGISRMGVRRG